MISCFLSPRLPGRLPSFGKSAVVCLDVCRTSAFNIRYVLTFAEPRQGCRRLSGRCRGVVARSPGGLGT